MNKFSVWTARAWNWLWLQVSLALACAAAKNLNETDVPLRAHAFAILFLCIVATVLSRLVSVLLFERTSLLWRVPVRVLGCLVGCLKHVLFIVTKTNTGKVIMFNAVLYLLFTLSYWVYTNVDIRVLRATWDFIAAIPAYVWDLPKLALAAEDWIQAWGLRDIVLLMREQVVKQKLLVKTKPLWSLVYMAFVLAVMVAVWALAEFVIGSCRKALDNLSRKMDVDEASA